MLPVMIQHDSATFKRVLVRRMGLWAKTEHGQPPTIAMNQTHGPIKSFWSVEATHVFQYNPPDPSHMVCWTIHHLAR